MKAKNDKESDTTTRYKHVNGNACKILVMAQRRNKVLESTVVALKELLDPGGWKTRVSVSDTVIGSVEKATAFIQAIAMQYTTGKLSLSELPATKKQMLKEAGEGAASAEGAQTDVDDEDGPPDPDGEGDGADEDHREIDSDAD